MIYEELPKGETRQYAQSAYTFLEYAFFSYIFWYNLRSKPFKNLILILSILFIVFQIAFVTSTTHRRLDSIPVGIETILVFIYIFYFFYEFSKYIKDTFIYNHYPFWIAVGVMIYLGGSFFFYIMANHMTDAEIDRYWELTYIGEIIKNILFAYAIFLFVRQKKENGFKNKILPNLDMV